MPAMAAITKQLRFATFALKLPIHHPVMVAKQTSPSR
jgi:alkanesulfonate monooxygenase SsuD/methylene tetrahydromethanopterin reductase-like flavin-dependent oxidoreductase (luciferase family)